MKILIRVFLDGEERSIRKMSKQNVESIKKSVIEWGPRKKVVNFQSASDGFLTGVDDEFVKTYCNKMLRIIPDNVKNRVEIVFNFASVNENICNCMDVMCEADCGSLACGCIEVCRCKNYW